MEVYKERHQSRGKVHEPTLYEVIGRKKNGKTVENSFG
jgi:hypothetical protein